MQHATKKRLLIGAHMSIAKGFNQSVIDAESIGCSAYQIFTKSNRQWHAKPLTDETADTFQEAVAHSTIQSNHIIAHATYLINLGSPDKKIVNSSIKALIDELHRCEQLKIPYLVLHPGSHTTGTAKDSISAISDHINTALEQKTKTVLLLENMAGQGSTIGKSFEELEQIYTNIEHKKRVGFCFDTCHAFAAGYSFSTHATYEAMWQEFDERLGIEKIHAIHMNDSKKECGSRVDRHENIGKGALGIEAFELLINDKRFFDVVKILETPKTSLQDDAKNLNVLRSLVHTTTKKLLDI